MQLKGWNNLMLNIQLTQAAERDLQNIATYTLKNFGYAQAQKYYSGLSSAIDTLTEFPSLGTSQDEIKLGLRRFIYQLHSIYFSVDDGDLLIYRVLNQKQDPLRHIHF